MHGRHWLHRKAAGKGGWPRKRGQREGEQGGPPKHVSRYAYTSQWWGCRSGAAPVKEPEGGSSVWAPPADGFYAQHGEAAAAGVAEFCKSAFLRLASVAQGSPGSTPALMPRLAGCSQKRDEGSVDSNLDPSLQRQVATVAPALRQTRAAARSSGAPLRRNTPERGHAIR